MERLTIGYRCRIKPTSSWATGWGYGNREVILKERSVSNFSAILLKEGRNVSLDRVSGTVEDCIAWLSESELELVDKSIDDNIRFLDWYEEAQEYECPDCGWLCQEDYAAQSDIDDDYACPKCGCIFL